MSGLPLLHLPLLREGKNLLAFSHGVDSTALFHRLVEEGIPFDLALVNYRTRSSSDREAEAAQKLALRFGRHCFVREAPRFAGDFENEARRFRYRFFETLIEEKGYENLLTAHQLDDRFEWMLMRLRRGAGSLELSGPSPLSSRRTPEGRPYRLIRPLAECSRREIESYLRSLGVEYFQDESNRGGENERSEIRELCGSWVSRNAEGLRRSFRYLERDARMVRRGWKRVFEREGLCVLRLADPESASRAADERLKESGHLLTAAERERIDRDPSVVVGRRWAVERRGSFLYIAPYLQGVVLPKAFRERCRRLGLPPKIRPYCYRSGIDPGELPGDRRDGEMPPHRSPPEDFRDEKERE
jgi:tRNA(Ile)-lysidine synthase